jgi:hypothetical protein
MDLRVGIPDPAQGGTAKYRKVRQMITDKIRAELPQLLAQRPKKSAWCLKSSPKWIRNDPA